MSHTGFWLKFALQLLTCRCVAPFGPARETGWVSLFYMASRIHPPPDTFASTRVSCPCFDGVSTADHRNLSKRLHHRSISSTHREIESGFAGQNNLTVPPLRQTGVRHHEAFPLLRIHLTIAGNAHHVRTSSVGGVNACCLHLGYVNCRTIGVLEINPKRSFWIGQLVGGRDGEANTGATRDGRGCSEREEERGCLGRASLRT